MDADMTGARATSAHLIDSSIFGHLWSAPWSRDLFDERARLTRWLDVIAALARAQATVGIVPAESAATISALGVGDLDVARIAEGTRATSHSTLGLIHELQRVLPDSARDHVYVGATVQDITDTSLALEIRAAGEAVWSDLWSIGGTLVECAEQHRDTPMTGRTHGQPGAPITFGYKAASWLDELGRHQARLEQGRSRWLVAQLGGAVGTLAFFGDQALALRRAFCAELGLGEPAISWLTARDRLAEFAHVLATIATSLARLANEVYSLQRQEIGELAEATTASVVGSITMPHKRNPESSEQIVTLARLARAQSAVLADTMVQEHERDARAWKAEWVAFPELCHYAGGAIALARTLVDGLEVRVEAMRSNLLAAHATSSEELLRQLTPVLGKHRAQDVLHEGYAVSRATGRPLAACLPDGLVLAPAPEPLSGAAAAMADAVVVAARSARAGRDERWTMR